MGTVLKRIVANGFELHHCDFVHITYNMYRDIMNFIQLLFDLARVNVDDHFCLG